MNGKSIGWESMKVAFGGHLRRCRKASGLTDRQFASKAKITSRTIQRIEEAVTVPKIDTLLMFAMACDITLKELFEPWISNLPETEDEKVIEIARRVLKHPLQGATLRSVIRSFEPSSVNPPRHKNHK